MSANLASDPRKILSLIEQLCDLSHTEIQQRLNRYVQNETNAKVVFLISIPFESEEMVIYVIGEEILDRQLRFPIKNNVLYEAVTSMTTLVTSVEKLDQDLLRYINRIANTSSSCLSLLTIPIQHPFKNYTALLVCLVNRMNCTEYMDGDESDHACIEIVQECFRFCLGYILSSLRYFEEIREKQQCQNLLAVSRKLYTHLGDLTDLLREIMAEVRKLTNAERCSLFLLDPDQQDLVAKVFDGLSTKENANEMRIPIGQGIAGHVATSGKLLNIRDAYNHPLFYRGVDELTGFRTRNILCFPIRDEKGIIGVAQLCNKMDGLYFDVSDEEIATAFSIYCGISIMHSIVYKKMQDAQARNKLSNEIMMYHMKVEESAVEALLNCRDDHSIKNFDEFHFNPRNVPYKHIPCYVIRMITDLTAFQQWRIKMSTLARFILYVKKGYRDAPYHNWIHAFSVTHFGYLLIKNMQLVDKNYMTPLHALVFLVSCLCHDIDHRGTNNTFQTKLGTVLASLYSSEGSVMERHHLAQTMCILNTEGCNIFESFDSDEYSEVLDLLRNNILATDLASHFRSRQRQEQMIRDGYNKDDPRHRKLLFELFMTCCDLSDQTKDWRVVKKTAEQIYDEFFTQGDIEKSMGSAPVEMMDRERASIPDLQIEFITNLVIPIFTNLSLLFSSTAPLVSMIERNRSLWEVAKDLFQKYYKNGMKGIDILLDPNFEDEVLATLTSERHCSASNFDECKS
ncbi:cGMP-dependent 3',5'-cyclic phosphodiesterase isoform X2 [Harpegnathos saltator]|uniref:Phosphodiesterase n=1 Tax=Harpegnathos saltator TaxID=610380 RepID=E2BF09_HARSA|nr:cGMP-dependent 3',5'-cyclic phosphodiesterase isoform X2 [Harpegnathos saltator]EFN85732.1 cGMP-dependent 3',5'-cyclic phosphodiesterase [Harpegnathos saltator]